MAVKKEIGAGTLLLILLGVWLWQKDKAEAAPAPTEVPPEGPPEIKVIRVGWEGSPQTATITKYPGDSFSALIDVENTGGAGSVTFDLHIGQLWRGYDDIGEAGSPWFRTVTVARGRSTVRMDMKLNPANAWNGEGTWQDAWLRVNGSLVWKKADCFRIMRKVTAPAVEVLGLSWL